MESINDVLTSVKATLYERVSNPLLSTFVISWSLWNYKIIWILFSGLDVKEKFALIEKLYPIGFWGVKNWDPNYHTILWLLLLPIGTSLFYLYYLYPNVGKKVYAKHKDSINEYEKIKVDFEGEAPISREKLSELKTKLRTFEEIASVQLDNKDKVIERINIDKENLINEIAEYKNELSSLSSIKNKYNEAEENINKLQGRYASLKNEYDAIVSSLRAAEKKVQGLERKETGLQSHNDRLGTRLVSLVNNLKVLINNQFGETVMLVVDVISRRDNLEKSFSGSHIAGETGMTLQQVQKALNDLENGGFVKKDTKSMLYHLTKEGADFFQARRDITNDIEDDVIPF